MKINCLESVIENWKDTNNSASSYTVSVYLLSTDFLPWALSILSIFHYMLCNASFTADKLYLPSLHRTFVKDTTFHATLPSKIKPVVPMSLSSFHLVINYLSFVHLLLKDFDPRCPPCNICCLNLLYIIHICLHTLTYMFL